MSSEEKYINVLLFGESGVGKSTFVNSLANYLTQEKFKTALKIPPQCLIPFEFYSSSLDAKDEDEVILMEPNSDGNVDKEIFPGMAAYIFNIEGIHLKVEANIKDEGSAKEGSTETKEPNKRIKIKDETKKRTKLRIIKTISSYETKESDELPYQNKIIWDFIATFRKLHAVCVLLKPNISRLSPILENSLRYLFLHLQKFSVENVMFVFTNARTTFYRSGETKQVLDKLLREIRPDPPGVKFDKENTFLMDNETFQLLVARHKGIKFSKDEIERYENSWKRSIAETQRFLDYIFRLGQSEEEENGKEVESMEIGEFNVGEIVGEKGACLPKDPKHDEQKKLKKEQPKEEKGKDEQLKEEKSKEKLPGQEKSAQEEKEQIVEKNAVEERKVVEKKAEEIILEKKAEEIVLEKETVEEGVIGKEAVAHIAKEKSMNEKSSGSGHQIIKEPSSLNQKLDINETKDNEDKNNLDAQNEDELQEGSVEIRGLKDKYDDKKGTDIEVAFKNGTKKKDVDEECPDKEYINKADMIEEDKNKQGLDKEDFDKKCVQEEIEEVSSNEGDNDQNEDIKEVETPTTADPPIYPNVLEINVDRTSHISHETPNKPEGGTGLPKNQYEETHNEKNHNEENHNEENRNRENRNKEILNNEIHNKEIEQNPTTISTGPMATEKIPRKHAEAPQPPNTDPSNTHALKSEKLQHPEVSKTPTSSQSTSQDYRKRAVHSDSKSESGSKTKEKQKKKGFLQKKLDSLRRMSYDTTKKKYV